jgi:aspartyl-tRNA synthetase
MSLRCVHARLAGGKPGLWSSYVEISRFVRTRHHGITPSSIRRFTDTRALQSTTEPSEQLSRALSNFKETCT